MKTINVYLSTKDPDYSMALANSIMQHSKYFSFQSESRQNEHDAWDIYLTDEMNSSEHNTVFLTDDPALATISVENSCYIVHKYQHVGHISNILRLAYSDFTKSEMLSDDIELTNVISICSSSGGSGCTSVALGVCQELSRFYGKKVLYISLEEFESTTNFFVDSWSENNNITKFIYTILNKAEHCNYTPIGYMKNDEFGIYTFHPARGRNPLYDLTGNEFVKFINHIAYEKLFTDLVLDCGNGLNDSITAAFRLSSRIIHVTGKSQDVHRKANYLSTMASKLSVEDSIGVLEVLNFYTGDEPENGVLPTETKNAEFMIEEDSVSFDVVNGRHAISLDKNFGQGIRELTQHLILTDR